MEISQIRYFVNLASTLNFTEAARLSGVSQPSLTKAIRRLEEELGGPLLYRDGKDSRLTALGRELQVEFSLVENILDNVREIADRAVAGRSVVIKVGVATTVAPRLFAGFWSHVLAELPMIDLVFEPLQPKEDEAEVLSGKYDLCLLPDAPADNFKLAIVPLFRERLLVGLARHHALASCEALTPEQMSEEPYLDRLHCEFRTRLISFFKNQHIVMRPRVQSEREDWIQNLVAEGLGIAAIPEHSLTVDGVMLREVAGLTLARDVALVAVSGSGTPREVRQILRLAERHDWGPSQISAPVMA